jgi:RNA-directed DNA polymerase
MTSPTGHLAILAIALVSGAWTAGALRQRARKLLGPTSGPLATKLIDEILTLYRQPYAPTWEVLVRVLSETTVLEDILDEAAERIASTPAVLRTNVFRLIAPLSHLAVPKLTTVGQLARWLEIPTGQIEWIIDHRRSLDREKVQTLRHYDYHWRQKRAGGWRLIEAPKPRTKAIQRRILDEIVSHLPPHDAAYGFVPGRSCTEAAAKHAGEDVVITVDLRDFFLSTPLRRVHAVFRCLGYPHAVARALTSLCSTSTPRHISAEHFDFEGRQRHLSRHLPQGAPTSPALANLAALGLDRRLTGLANRFDVRYTRYADDLTFSGDRSLYARAKPLLTAVEAIAHDEGYALNAAKTRIMPRHARQTVTGIVVNDHINVARNDFDALKATLTNCVRHGAQSQNRDAHADFRAHLDGRIAWVERLNLRRGEKLRRIFDEITWQGA